MSEDKMSKREIIKRRRSQKQLRNWLLIGAGIVMLALIAVIWLRAALPSAPNTSSPDVAGNLPNSSSALNVGTLIGQPAPAFMLMDASGQPYKFQAGNGHKYVLAFNMGYV